MKNWKKLSVMGILFGALLLGTTTAANTGAPGTAEDPLVTKSYMDEQIAKMKEELRQELAVESGGGGAGLVVERLEDGQKLIGAEGTEIIVRSGNVVGIIGPGGNGIPDLTAGTDIRGTKIPLNHLLLIPRSDGRGIEVISGPSHVMVRGSYEIE